VAQQRADETLELILVHQLEQLARAALGDDEAEPVRRAAGLFLDRHLGEHREVGASVLGGQVVVGEALLARFLAQRLDLVLVDLAALDDAHLGGVELLLDEAPRARLEVADLGGQVGDDHPWDPKPWLRTRSALPA
jgi:hypothetical protein